MPEDNRLKKATASVAGAIALASGTASADQVEYGSDEHQFEYNDEWNYVDHYSAAYGDDRITSSSTNEPVAATQSITMSLSYDDSKNMGSIIFPQIWIPGTKNHEIEVEEFSNPGTSIRITDLQESQQGNSGSGEIDPVAEAALSYLVSVVSSASNLPLPDPFALQNDSKSVEREVDSTTYVHLKFNDSPPVQGINWLTHVNTPVVTGWYRMNARTSTDAGFRIDGSPVSTDDSNTNYHYPNFQVYR
ncbi:hypothetical protein [Halostagnicola larsenii]|uniref:hypothetical protein n=1 Tax=Halostagnicola larsenii TaxID=353800 RepID=UPI0012F70BDC|nr:hypothetical protein [Halostagnicola larsenii]